MFRSSTHVCANKAILRRVLSREEIDSALEQGCIESNPGPQYGVITIQGDDVIYGDLTAAMDDADWFSENMPSLEEDDSEEQEVIPMWVARLLYARRMIPPVFMLFLVGKLITTRRLRYVFIVALLLALKRKFVRTWAFFFGGGNRLVCIESNPGPRGGKGGDKGKGKDPDQRPYTKNSVSKGSSGGSSGDKAMYESLKDGFAQWDAAADVAKEMQKQIEEIIEECNQPTISLSNPTVGDFETEVYNKPLPPTPDTLPCLTRVVAPDDYAPIAPPLDAAAILKGMIDQEQLAGYERMSDDQLEMLQMLVQRSRLVGPRDGYSGSCGHHGGEGPNTGPTPFSDFHVLRGEVLSYCTNGETKEAMRGSFIIDTLPKELWPTILPASYEKVRSRMDDYTWNEFYNGLLKDFDVIDPFELVTKVEFILAPFAYYLQDSVAAIRPHRDTEHAHRDRIISVMQPLLRVSYRTGLFRYYYIDAPKSEIHFAQGNWFGRLFEFKSYTADTLSRFFRRFDVEACGRSDQSDLFRFKVVFVSVYQLVELYSRRVILTPKLDVKEQVNRLIRFYAEDPNTSTHLNTLLGFEANVLQDTMSVISGIITKNARTSVQDF